MRIGNQETGYDREELALYLTGLLPHDPEEAKAVLDLCYKLVAVVLDSRKS